ncbi:beta-glucosidase [Parabacteroides sp. PF5-5]|uniref:beta-glucosidase BglX n=1 Tax=unclassified Parabacteroides TaxID=2649774 RepID=UPI002473843F|nr:MULTISPECIES: beta-glucosidase BglX [unclassified Parabacteroides]MDH6305042.1 beta-glucosidase [Parabacteroides sp. PH5-39]MDH6315873.1 beta-glucosidase [Parabacteroides sp. PF5-13]MDH6319530.1 beta-glucosidase [Parabacteroides sp. PH5-13]MDH6323261.1 beta-glucosidase [Parabacteroides sp. PH5-8]MDH6327231.1 beta-glucosidase [Parabacteroides sp. PH5-41]
MRNIITIAICMISILLLSCENKTSAVVSAKDNDVEKRIEALLKQMTLEEKIGQMYQISSFDNSGKMQELVKKGEIGSVLNLTNPEVINALQQVAMEESRLKIPLIVGRDVIHGFKTIFPIPLGQAASFNPQLVEDGARVAAIEAASCGINWTFAPMIDIARDPRWGRIAESLGEDPYLTSVLGAAMIKGFQSEDLSGRTAIAACPKHFVGYGAAEAGKDYNSTFIPERTLRNVYLPSFETAVRAGAATFMTSFNDNDGVPSSGNKFILDQVLRKEWQFDGFVVSDWESIREMIPHGFCKDEKEAAEKAVNAGVDMEMVSPTYTKYLKELLDEGKVKMATIDNAVRNILRIKFRLGLFENPFVDINSPSVLYAEEHLQKAKQAAIESAVLLKNEKATLPLNEQVKTIAVIGPMADAPHDQMGTWVFDGDKNYTQTPLKALQAAYGDKIRILYAKGTEYSRDKSTAGIPAAVAAARNADVALIFVGEESILSGEAHSLTDLHLQGAQSELIEAVAKTGKPVVTVVMAGRPLTIGRDVEHSQAVLYNFHPGTMGGPAIIDLLFGKAVPSGKLPVTFPKNAGQTPMYYAHNNTGRPYQGNETMLADIPLEAGQTSLGNTSFHLDAGFDPLYPFGYGLSYTTFEYSNLALSAGTLKPTDVLTVTIDITNTGKHDATEIAQLYTQDCFASVTRPVKELKRFERISLKAGEKKTLTFTLPVEELAFYNIDMKKVVEAGNFNLWVGPHSQEGLKASFVVN